MFARHQAIVAQTIELRRGLWHISAIGWSLALLSILSICAATINTAQMMRYSEALYPSYFSPAFTDSLLLIVYCVLAGFAVLVAHKFFTARAAQFQLEMDRLSLAFIERIARLSKRAGSVLEPVSAELGTREIARLNTQAIGN